MEDGDRDGIIDGRIVGVVDGPQKTFRKSTVATMIVWHVTENFFCHHCDLTNVRTHILQLDALTLCRFVFRKAILA